MIRRTGRPEPQALRGRRADAAPSMPPDRVAVAQAGGVAGGVADVVAGAVADVVADTALMLDAVATVLRQAADAAAGADPQAELMALRAAVRDGATALEQLRGLLRQAMPQG